MLQSDSQDNLVILRQSTVAVPLAPAWRGCWHLGADSRQVLWSCCWSNASDVWKMTPADCGILKNHTLDMCMVTSYVYSSYQGYKLSLSYLHTLMYHGVCIYLVTNHTSCKGFTLWPTWWNRSIVHHWGRTQPSVHTHWKSRHQLQSKNKMVCALKPIS